MFSGAGGKTLVLQANSTDSVASVHSKIELITRIRPTFGAPAMEQRLIYRGKQLQLSQTLSECGIQNDDTLQLSMRHPRTWRLMNDLNSLIHDQCNCNNKVDINANVAPMRKMLTKFLAMTRKDAAKKSKEYLLIFIHSAIPAALDVFPFVLELAKSLVHSLELSERSAEFTWLSANDVDDFIKFMHPIKCAIRLQEAFGRPACSLLLMQGEAGLEIFEIEGMYEVFRNLLGKLDQCLKKLESQLAERGEPIVCCWCWYLLILKELKSLSKLSKVLEEMLWDKMRQRRVALCFLIVKLSGRYYTDYLWILKHKEVTFFKVRQCFALKMLREGSDRNEEVYEMLICRSRLFEESFEYIGHVDTRLLQGHLFMQFKNEEATGLGVLREWFSFVCQAIFNRRNALFVSCPNYGTRFFPNPASKVDLLHLEYFIFSGRMIVLALLHKVQISIEFDQLFFL